MAFLHLFQIEPFGHRFLQVPGESLVTQDEVGHLLAQRRRIGDLAKPRLRRAAVVFQFQHVLEHRKAAFRPRDAE